MISASKTNWLLLLSIPVFAVSCAWQIGARLNTSWAIRDSRLDIGYTHEIAENQQATWEFASPTHTLDRLWIFFHPISPEKDILRTLSIELDDAPTGERLAEMQLPLSIDDYRGGRALLEFQDLTLPKNRELRLTVSLPGVAADEGFYLHYQADQASTGRVVFGDSVIDRSDLSMLWFASQRGFPAIHAIAGIALLLALRVSAQSGALPPNRALCADAIVVWGLLLLAGGFMRDLSVAEFYGNYWPDEYPPMARDWLTLFRGELEWSEFRDRLSEWRNGQVFLVPLALGFIQYLGAGAAASYQLLVALFSGGSIILFIYVGKRFIALRSWEWLALYACALTSPYLLHAASSFQTDSAGLFFSFLALIAISRTATNSAADPRIAISGIALAIAAAIFTRLSNLAFLALPACVALWMSIASDSKDRSTAKVLWTSSILCSLFCALVWHQLGLFETIEKAKAFSELPQFRSQFSWESFATQTLLAGWPAFLALIDPRSLRANPLFYTIGGGICALLAILALGKIITWQRYWIPIAIPSLALGFAFAASRNRRGIWIGALALGSVSLNMWMLL